MSPQGRTGVASTLASLAAIGLLLALVTGYAVRVLLDPSRFADRAASALEAKPVADEIAERATDDLIGAEADLVAVRPVIEEVIAGAVRTGAFRGLFRTAVRDLHRTVVERDDSSVTLTLIDVGAIARGGLMALDSKLANRIPAGTDAAVLELNLPGPIVRLIDHRTLPWLLLLAVVLLFAGALVVSPDRRRVIVVFGVAIMLSGVIAAVILRTGEALALSRIDPGQPRDAVQAIGDAYLDDLRTGLLLFAACGAVVSAAASSLLRPLDIGEPLRRGWHAVTQIPGSARARVTRAVLLVAGGILIVARTDWFVELGATLIGLYIAYAGASELMRLTIGQPDDDGKAFRPGWRPFAATAVIAIAVIIAGAVFAGVEGVGKRSETIGTEGCNGAEALCDRSLEQVVFPATHNSMSGATYPDFLFAQQETGLTGQLRDGIRGLLIDAYYGRLTESGRVLTDLSDIDGAKRQLVERELGSAAFDAALRTRERIAGSAKGKREIYLCHGFCEPGAIRIESAFSEIRNFLAANPNEVLLIVIEDYVDPADIEAVVERTGLFNYVYTGPLGAELPTLREMIDSGGRVVITAENDAGNGSIPWYHLVYEELLQETPFFFRTVEALVGEDSLTRSCEPNRGTDSAPLFLINHWVDTPPAPRPSNAAIVNARAKLLPRIEHCVKQRDLVPNLIAVDFYRQGDLFEVADELNQGLDPAAPPGNPGTPSERLLETTP